jgi:voltage-gated potassium channel
VSLAERYNAFIDRHEVAWELTMGALAAAFVTIGFAGDTASPDMAPVLATVELVLTAIFFAEFSTRLAASRDRRRYLRGHWIDLIALWPAVREVRLLRLLRLLRLIRTFAGIYRALSRFERVARNRGLVLLFIAWLSVAVISSTALYLAESDINPNLHSPMDALWWGIVTLTTVGYGDVYPVTPEGRLAGAALMILGITLFATITGTITSLLIANREEDQQTTATTPQLIQALGQLRASGLITDEEFQDKKRELLDRM